MIDCFRNNRSLPPCDGHFVVVTNVRVVINASLFYQLRFVFRWVYSDQSTTKSLPFSGSISTYGGGGFYVDFKNGRNATIDIIKELKDNLWITRGTRAVILDFSVYNANVNIFGICKLLFEFPTIGGVIPNAYIQSTRLIRLHHSYDYFILFCEILFYCFILLYILEEIREIIYFRLRYFRQFWSYVDMIIIMVSPERG